MSSPLTASSLTYGGGGGSSFTTASVSASEYALLVLWVQAGEGPSPVSSISGISGLTWSRSAASDTLEAWTAFLAGSHGVKPIEFP